MCLGGSAVEKLMPIHDAQLLTYLKLTRCKVDLLINFNAPLLHKGIKRLVMIINPKQVSS
ncbi:GxxExxY protein [Methylomarinum sp. Ch1-1]|uniref:GxxExxY protein n=1 Tax=Methylomarinum roseum TaxID=3067653 RepID=A0AAU7P043_9GAMM|nr:GxxExxY protein [Methylomarinum sp. Ch1-1]MDP4519454.1 GxxExxY protein [Methylomarinum sp. Ch1-1]